MNIHIISMIVTHKGRLPEELIRPNIAGRLAKKISGMHLSETTIAVIHHRSDVVINRMAHYISQGRVETPIRRGGQFYHSFVANLLQYLCAKNYQNTVRFDKVIAKIEGYNFFASH